MADITTVIVEVPQRVQAVTVEVPQRVQSVVVETGHPGLKGEPGDPGPTFTEEILHSKWSLGTGVIDGCVLSIDPDDHTKAKAIAGHSLYVDCSTPGTPVIETLALAATSVVPLVGTEGLDTTFKVWVGIERASSGVGALVFSKEFFSASDRRRIAVLGTLWATGIGSTTITAVSNYQTPAWGASKTLEDFAYAMGGSINIDGNDISAHAGTLTLDKSAGHAFRLFGAASTSKDVPNNPPAYGAAPVAEYLYWAASGLDYGNASSATIDPDYYDNGGARTPVPSGKWTIQRIYWFPSTRPTPIVAVTYGQTIFDTLEQARSEANNQAVVFSSFATNALFGGLLRARLYVQQGMTTLDAAYVERMTAFIGGGAAGGGGVGEINTGSNINERGTGVYIQKIGFDLQFAGLDSDDPLINVSYDTPTKALLLSTNIYTGTGDPPGDLPEGSLYFKIV